QIFLVFSRSPDPLFDTTSLMHMRARSFLPGKSLSRQQYVLGTGRSPARKCACRTDFEDEFENLKEKRGNMFRTKTLVLAAIIATLAAGTLPLRAQPAITPCSSAFVATEMVISKHHPHPAFFTLSGVVKHV